MRCDAERLVNTGMRMEELETTGEFIIPDRTSYEIYQEHINRYAFASNFVQGKVVLDIACGVGYGSSHLMKRGAKILIGGDLSKDAIKYAKTHYYDEGLSFIRLDATNLPFPGGRFDMIASFETIEHIKEYKKFLEECRRVLKKRGIFICSTPNKQLFSPKTEKPWNPFHAREFNRKEFCNLVTEYFTEVKLYGQLQRPSAFKTRVKSKLFRVGGKTLSIIPEGHKIKEFVKRTFLSSKKPSYNAKLGKETLDKRYEVKKIGLFNIPLYMISKSQKR